MAEPTIVNGGFDVDLSSWSTTGGPTWTRDTSVVHSGAGSTKLVNAVAAADNYIAQDVDSIGQGLVGGAAYVLSGWVNVTAFTAAAFSNRGFYVHSYPAVTLETWNNITAATAGWVYQEIRFTLPLTETGVNVRLYSPQGTIYWDDILFYRNPAAVDVMSSAKYPRPALRRRYS